MPTKTKPEILDRDCFVPDRINPQAQALAHRAGNKYFSIGPNADFNIYYTAAHAATGCTVADIIKTESPSG